MRYWPHDKINEAEEEAGAEIGSPDGRAASDSLSA
jgi:hypothetical protein